MGRLLLVSSLALVAPAACSFVKSSSNQAPSAAGDGGADAVAPGPATATCQGDATLCLSGTVTTARSLAAVPNVLVASLFRVFPSGQEMPLSSQTVATDGTWAFSNLPAWAHYYVRIAAEISVSGAAPSTLTSIAGPLTVPSTGHPTAVQVRPVELQVLESRLPGAGSQVQWASAHVFDPVTGDEMTGGAQVSIDIGGTSTAMPWGADSAGKPAYFVQFTTPPAAQSMYEVTTSAPAFGSTPLTWTLVADPPAFDAGISAPASNATIPVGQPLSVTWPAHPTADYEVVELFAHTPSGWTGAWQSPAPDSPDATQETVPGSAIGAAGPYLLNVVFSKANCPTTSDGCVYAGSVADVQLTAQ